MVDLLDKWKRFCIKGGNVRVR